MNTAKKLSIRLEAVGGDKVRQEFNAIGNDATKARTNTTQDSSGNLTPLAMTLQRQGLTPRKIPAVI